MSAGPLAGMRVLVTRPRERAAGLQALIRAAGGEPVSWPAIEIGDPEDPAALDRTILRLKEFDLAIFISPTAVERGLARIEQLGSIWPAHLPVAAIGAGTRRGLEERGFAEVIVPAGNADSEALLGLPALEQSRGKRVVIFRGKGGRELLPTALAERGAIVEFAECYRRIRPQIAASSPAWATKALQAVTVSSGEGLENVAAALGRWRPEWTRESALFVPHPRIGDAARGLGVREVIVAGASDEEIAARLVAYFRDAK